MVIKCHIGKQFSLLWGVFLSILGVPSESGIVSMVSKELLCSFEINQCSIANTISVILFVAGILAILEDLI